VPVAQEVPAPAQTPLLLLVRTLEVLPLQVVPPTTPPPADTRPPEEVYETQLRQLNEMGFYEFDRNVSALRRSGGNVQGAIEYLLNGGA
jgi:hypothetical protein